MSDRLTDDEIITIAKGAMGLGMPVERQYLIRAGVERRRATEICCIQDRLTDKEALRLVMAMRCV